MAKPLLSYRGLAAALISRLTDGDDMAVGRDRYVGCSEVGGCPRLVSYRKALGIPWIPDPEAAGYMLPGQLVENETIQFLRILGLDRDLTGTGRAQVELQEDCLRSHPDGLLADNCFDLDPLSTYFKFDGTAWDLAELRAVVVGPGVVEVKSGSSTVFKKSVKRGLSETYIDQTVGNMGLSGRGWTLLIMVCRDSLSKMAMFFLPASPARFHELKHCAARIIGAAAVARAEIEEAMPTTGWPTRDDEDWAIEACSGALLAPDEERGYCMKCPLRHTCPALVKTCADGLFPESVQLELEAWAEIYSSSSEAEKAAKQDKEEARDRIKELADQYGANRALLSPPFTTLSVSEQLGREGCDLTLLKSNFPEAYAACVSRGDSYAVVRVNKKKGGSK